ncbi:hypothetical protein Sjap_023458 [Stephania japonica]|uniref:Uncharacterized protein n=1 Tax=Stephania japonica TaxID=461633 RepID=A0AAP0EBM2_9MAGN
MESVGDEDADAVLSDLESDDPVPVSAALESSESVSVERFREVLAELERERRAREAAESSKSEIQVSFNRLKALAHEAIKKRDESARQREEAVREKEEALRLNERIRGELEEALRLKDEGVRQFEEIGKARDSLKAETDTAAHMLVTGIEKISGKVSNFKNFSVGGLPKSQKYTGLPAVAYGVIKRTNDIVEELVKQHENATKSRNAAREQMEQRNYEIAIEVSQLEAAISGLREEVAKKTSEVENLAKLVSDKDEKISIMDKEIGEHQSIGEKEAADFRQLVDEYDQKLRNLESKMDSQRSLVIDQLNYISRIHNQIHNIIKIVDATPPDQTELSDSLVLPQEVNMDKNLLACLDLMESSYELVKMASGKVRDAIEEKSREAKCLNETVDQLIKEKQQIGSLLRSALPRKVTIDPSSKMSKVLQVAENSLREIGRDVNLSNLVANGEAADHSKLGSEEEDELYTLAGALENIVKASQLEIIELHHSLEELRTESTLLKAHMEAQADELNRRNHRMVELEEKERLANESIEGLMMDIAAAEEEIARWKVAAEQEAAAGGAVEQEFVVKSETIGLSQFDAYKMKYVQDKWYVQVIGGERFFEQITSWIHVSTMQIVDRRSYAQSYLNKLLSALQQELDEAKQGTLQLEQKLKFKEQTAAAAMSARDAAEKSLRLADLRSSRLRERLEELSRQLEESDTREGSNERTRPRYICWPWQWLGLNYMGTHLEPQQPNSNEMELSEPLL